MIFSITLHTKYNQVQLALSENDKIIEITELENKFSSANLIPTIDALIKSRALNIHDLSYIAINSGPAPFTSLRTTISTANGIAFATKIPLISVCAIDLLLKEQRDKNFKVNIALINAFGNDVYFAIEKNGEIEIGVENIDNFLEKINKIKDTINFFGNGTQLYKFIILEKLSNRANIKEDFALECSVQSVAQAGYEKWQI